MPPLRSLITYAAVMAAVFVAAAVVGYVYQYDPERDLVEVVIDRSSPPVTDTASGTVSAVADGTIRIDSSLGALEVDLDDVVFEELRSLDEPGAVSPGLELNLGGDRTATERIIRGVVLIGAGAAP